VGILQTVSEHPLTRTANKRRNLKLEPLDVPLVATVGARGRLTLPKAARDHLSLSEGDPVLVVVGSHWLQLVPADLISRDELWSLTGPIRRRIESAEDDVDSGRAASAADPRTLRRAVRQFIEHGS
jgi:AbrB family looped-hinge helix DNA binding protein